MNNKVFAQLNLLIRETSDHKLDASKPIMMMLDGRCFSKFCKQFDKPFDYWFVKTMNKTAQYLCQHIQNAVITFVQSDEISIYLKPCEGKSEAWFDGRIQKMSAIAAAMASSFFTKELLMRNSLEANNSNKEGLKSDAILDKMFNTELVQFDCKVWNVNDSDNVVDWFTFRQRDCVRNSKQQFTQAFIPHKDLLNKSCDEQIQMCTAEIYGKHYWCTLSPGLKYGRLIYKVKETFSNNDFTTFERSVWKVKELESFDRTKFLYMITN